MLNVVAAVGRITRQPEVKEGNVKVCAFTIACERDKDHTDFIPCVAWRGTAEFVGKYIHKGDMIAVEGRLENNSFTNREGQRQDKWQVNISRVNFCGGGKREQAPLGEAEPKTVFYEEEVNGELPF